tara:strand:- start:189 stop:632 length:444 start_codon:yes stop_codon:yes gene_type:complete
MINNLQPGQILARGVTRHLQSYGFVSLQEFSPTRGLRADVMALGPRGEFWLVECKSSRVDFQTDRKWLGYLDWCDRYFWAVDDVFPTEFLPEDSGLIIADGFDAEIIRDGEVRPLAAARRKALMLRFATAAARRLQRWTDPDALRAI